LKIAILSGSNRKQSTGLKLCLYIEQLLIAKGHHVQLLNLNEQPVPLYNPDEKSDDDPNLAQLKQMMNEAQGIILSTPEYHGSISGVLKNALDHLGSEQFDSKPVLSISSAGGSVGTSSLTQIQTMVRVLHGINSPEWISMGNNQNSFDEQGVPLNNAIKERTIRALHYFLRLTDALTVMRD